MTEASSPRNADRHRRQYGLIAVLAIAQFAAATLLFYPGGLSPDSVSQYSEALSGKFTTQHPPMMAEVWRLLLPFGRGPVPMLFLNLLLYSASFAALAVYCSWRTRRATAAIAALAGLWPLLLNFSGMIWKDVTLSVAWGLGCALMLLATEWKDRGLRFWLLACASGSLLLFGATLRHNAAPAAIVLAFAFSLVFLIGRVERFITFACMAACMTAAVPLSSRFLHARDTREFASMVTWDLTGISFFSGHDYRSDLGGSLDAKLQCYSPRLYDACHPAAFASDSAALNRWRATIEREPLAYLKHRSLVFTMLMRFGCRECRPAILGMDFSASHHLVRRAFGGAVTALGSTPVGRPYLWLVVALGLAALLWRRAPPDSRAVLSLIPLSGVVYALSYFTLAPTDEFRYVYWLIYSVVLSGTAYLLTMKIDVRDLGRWIIAPAICMIFLDLVVQRTAPTDFIAPSMQTNY